MPRVTGQTMNTTTTPEWWFGRKAPTSATCAWGARAIYQYDSRDGWYIDILDDRQQGVGTAEHRRLLSEFLNTYAIPRMRVEFPKCEESVYAFEHDGWHVEANTHGNSGYLYMGAWPIGDVPQTSSAPYAPPPAPRIPRTKRRTTLPRSPWR